MLSGFLAGHQTFLLSRTNCDASDTFASLWTKAFRDLEVSRRKHAVGFQGKDEDSPTNVLDIISEPITPDEVRRTLVDISKSTSLILIFDEFDRVNNSEVTTLIADTIKSLSDYSVAATVLIIGVADSVDELIREHQSVERALVQIPMPRMSDDEIREIIKRGLKRLTMDIDAAASEELVGLSQDLPYIANLLGLHSCRAALKAQTKTITTTNVETGMERSLDQWQQSIKSAYYEATTSPQPGHIYKKVLLACALAEVDDLRYFTAAAVRKPLRIIANRSYEIPNFARHLKDLSNPGRGQILQRVGEKRRLRYRISNPMLRPYIIMRGIKERIITKALLRKITIS